MRSKRTTRKQLKAEIEQLREAVSAPSAPPREVPAACEAPPPKIAAGGYPTRTQPPRPKSLKEAKEILLSLREW